MKSDHKPLTIKAELSRDLGLTTALAIGIGTMIAAGIFTLSGLAIRNVGSAAILSFCLAALVASITALTYCEFVSIYPQSGEGYLYARKTFKAPLAYFVGWSLVLGYTASCAFYISSLSSYFYEFVLETPTEGISGLVVLAALILINIKGTKESANFQVVVTAGKVILLIWFIFGGLGSFNSADFIARFSRDIVQIGSTAGLVFITFFGFSAIAASAGEIRNPLKNIPRAIFISVAVVTVLYTLVIIVVVAAGLQEYTEAAMGVAASKFLGPIGGMIIIAGALFSMISASNASIMAGSRVTLSMSRLGHFPEGFGHINPQSRTPIVALSLVGGMILVFSIGFPLEDLAHFADTVLLLVLVFVNVALIIHRRKFPELKRPFRMPFVPLLPGLGIIANIYLLSQIVHHTGPVLMAVACLAFGVLAFLAWKGYRAEEEELPGIPSRIALGRYASDNGNYRILVPIANPANVNRLIDLASAVAAERSGQIVALRVILIPEQVPASEENLYIERERSILEQAHTEAQQHNIPLTSLVRIGRNAARAILETAREQNCDLILMGWKGFTSTARRILGETTDAVVTHAKRDLMLVKLDSATDMKHFLLPTAGGVHAQWAEQFIASIVRKKQGSLTVCAVTPENTNAQGVGTVEKRVEEAVGRLKSTDKMKVKSRIIKADSVTRGIINAAGDYDALVVGAAGDSMYRQILFGNIPETIAKYSNRPVILVKRYLPVKELIGRVMEE